MHRHHMLDAVGFVVDAARGLHAYRVDQSRKAGGGVRRPLLQTPLPLLRLLYLACTCAFLIGHTGQSIANWLHVSASTRQADVVHQSDPGDLRLDGASWFCLIVVGKFAPLNYVFCKFMCYSFFFIKQRTVRTMSPEMNWLEKLVLLATFGMFFFLGVAAWLIQGDSNALDGTCQMFIQIPFFLTMAGADSVLSAAYLFLFVQPLRETIRLNANRQRGMTAPNSTVSIVHSPTANKQASARVAPASLYAPEAGAAGPELSQAAVPARSSAGVSSPTAAVSAPASAAPASSAASAHTMSVALEAVMRRNTAAAAAAICSGVCHFAFSTTAMITDQPHMRKLTMPVALLVSTHLTWMQWRRRCCMLHLALITLIPCSPTSFWLWGLVPVVVLSQDCVVMIVSTRAKDSSSLDAHRSKAPNASAPTPTPTGDRIIGPSPMATAPRSSEAHMLRDHMDQPDTSPV